MREQTANSQFIILYILWSIGCKGNKKKKNKIDKCTQIWKIFFIDYFKYRELNYKERERERDRERERERERERDREIQVGSLLFFFWDLEGMRFTGSYG